MLDETERSLLRHLKREMNGAVVEAMARRGIVYPVSYGVSIADIRSIAGQYAPDHGLALRLYQSGVRESMLAALFIDDPAEVTAGQMRDWSAKFTNHEIVENTATFLFSKAVPAVEVALEWIGSADRMLCYAGMLTAAGALRVAEGAVLRVAEGAALPASVPSHDSPDPGENASHRSASGRNVPNRASGGNAPHSTSGGNAIDEKTVTDIIDSAARVPFRGDFDLTLSHGAVTLMERCARYSSSACSKVKELADSLNDSNDNLIRHTAGELAWRLDIL